jgi:hypothetical protein
MKTKVLVVTGRRNACSMGDRMSSRGLSFLLALGDGNKKLEGTDHLAAR